MNRRVLVVLGVVAGGFAVLVGIGLLTESEGDEPGVRALGAPESACSAAVDVPPTGASEHVGGTVVYDRIPPNSGKHAPDTARFFTRRVLPDGVPPVERVVHNLEHGWVVVWYDPDADDLAVLDQALDAVEERKVVAVPYLRGELPAPYVLTAWGHEQRCTQVSGAALADFVEDHAGENGDAPEPDAL